ncbi:hypothetical protein [Streptomyces caeruleatus]|uniref:hypothetical protein n=1 Tax=Streptomyces caeruleatus TaxID=661399 RepID=UPI00131BE7D3|nr:hypothetical protein [Streptomyces caeruleatus]
MTDLSPWGGGGAPQERAAGRCSGVRGCIRRRIRARLLGSEHGGKESAHGEDDGVSDDPGSVVERDAHRFSVEPDPHFARLKVHVDVGARPVDAGSGSWKPGREVASHLFNTPPHLGLVAVVLLHALVNVTVHGNQAI